MKKCMYCGQENEDSSVVCAKCGNTLLDIPMDQMPPLEDAGGDEQTAASTAEQNGSDVQASSEEVSSSAEVPFTQNTAPEQPGFQPAQWYAGDSGDSGYGQASAQDFAGQGYAQGNTGQGYAGQGYAQENTGQGYAGQGYPQGANMDFTGQGYAQGNIGQGYVNQGYPQGNSQGFSQEGSGLDGQGYASGNPGQAYAGGNVPQGDPASMGQFYPQGNAGPAMQGYPQGDQGYNGAAYGYGNPNLYGDQNEPQETYEEEGDENEEVFSNNMMEKARKKVHSPLFFLSTLCYTIAVIGSIVYAVTGGALTNLSTFSNTVHSMTGDNIALGYFDRLVTWVTAQDAANHLLSRVISGAAYLPAFLIMLGLWMAFVGISPKKEEAHTAGLTLIRVIRILEFIVMCVGLLALVGVCVAYVVAAGAAQTVMTLIVGVIALLVVVLLTVLVILYNIQLLFSIRAVRNNCKNGRDIGRIPGFVIFVGILGTLVLIASVLMMAPDDYIGLVSGGAQAAWMLFITIWAIVYRVTVRPE